MHAGSGAEARAQLMGEAAAEVLDVSQPAIRRTGIAKAYRKRAEGAQGEGEADEMLSKKPKIESMPDDFLEFLPPEPENANDNAAEYLPPDTATQTETKTSRQFWKAGDYEGSFSSSVPAGMDHVRVHPKFLHSNATSHKWALGAIAELLDNALDEVSNGATYINIEVVKHPKDGSPMLLFEDDGGGMTHERMRECMSFGYSAKTKSANTIGQYGNGFKTSTMRLGADVIVFSKSPAKNGANPTRSIGMLSYNFLRETGQQDIIVPMLDFEECEGLKRILRGSEADWAKTTKSIVRWGPYASEEILRNQFKKIKKQGTRILIYNLWENEENQLELDFETDPRDIQVRGAREDAKISIAEKYPSSRHYLLYRHSLRLYASILYLKLPKGFKISLRGEEIKHHNIVDDLMHTQELTYKPQSAQDGPGSNMTAVVTLGFVKDAEQHIDVQGFNVYHKNRLIKPFWRIWNSSSSQGRGIIGVLEANFVEPAHDKQGFERTPVLQRLEARLQSMQKTYWNKNCQKVGYMGVPPKKRTPRKEDEMVWQPTSGRKDKSARLPKKGKEAVYSSSPEETSEEEEEEAEERPARRRKLPAYSSPDEEDERPARRAARKLAGYSSHDEEEPARPARRSRTPVARRAASAAATNLNRQLEAERAPEVQPEEEPVPPMAQPQLEVEPVPEPVPAPEPELDALIEHELEPEPEMAVEMLKGLQEQNVALHERLEKLEEADGTKLQLEIARSKELEAQVTRMEEELHAVQRGLLIERDNYKEALEEEKRQRELDDREIRRQLKSALQRLRDVESEKKAIEAEKKAIEAQKAALEAEVKALREGRRG